MGEGYLNEAQIATLKQNPSLADKPVFDFFTRIIDILLSLIFILLTSPILIVVAIAVKATDGGPIFYSQDRTGLKGKPFKLIKFRSMIVGADKIGAKFRSYTNDERFTRIGKFIREYHIDELPQFFNILKGDMSIVGPRPALTFHIDYYEPWELVRARVRPGLTGLSQVSGGNALSWDERIVVDVYYVRHRNFYNYISIIWRTFTQLFYKKGIHGRDGIVKGWTRGLPAGYMDETMKNKN